MEIAQGERLTSRSQFWQLCGVLIATGVIVGSRKYDTQWAFRTGLSLPLPRTRT